jgi:hypothetical protein
MRDDKKTRMSEDKIDAFDSSAGLWKPSASGVSVRLLSPMGLYPAAADFRTEDTAVYLSPEICAVITKFSPIPHPDKYFHSGVEYLSAFEVRALAAPFLAKEHDTGAVSLYPVMECYRHPDTTLDLSKLRTLRSLARALFGQLKVDAHHRDVHHPPLIGGKAYEFNEHAEIDRRRLGRLYRMIDVNDHLLIRGLGSLLKAAMLRCHQEFIEHACMALWVSLDASFRIVLREMKKDGYINPGAKEAGQLLDDIFDSEYDSGGYFADFYEERIKTMHPESRFGIYPAAPLEYDEYSQLEASLRTVYELLITGHIDKSLRPK